MLESQTQIQNYLLIIYNVRFLGSGGVGGITITPSSIPCFTDTCFIKTPNGYINIIKLKKGDLVITNDNREIPIKKIFNSKIMVDLEKPHLIKANSYGENKPFLDTYISSKHRYKVNGEWTTPEKELLPKKWKSSILKYYHIQTDDYQNDILMVNGLEMETWDGKIPGDIQDKKNSNKRNKILKRLITL